MLNKTPEDRAKQYRMATLQQYMTVRCPRSFFGANCTKCNHYTASAIPTIAGRSRKRRRPRRRNIYKMNAVNNIQSSSVLTSSSSTITNEVVNVSSPSTMTSPYPKGRPWRVLWPRPHGDPFADSLSLSSSKSTQRIVPRINDLRQAWKVYMATWADGITGIPKKENTSRINSTYSNTSSTSASPTPMEELQNISNNAEKNLTVVRQDAQELLEQAKEKTGIRSQEDIKELASEMMTIATECIKEFMAGYREGRDKEIDKMLHEYFQGDNKNNDEEENTSTSSGSKAKSDKKSISLFGQEMTVSKKNELAVIEDLKKNSIAMKKIRRKRKPKRAIFA